MSSETSSEDEQVAVGGKRGRRDNDCEAPSRSNDLGKANLLLDLCLKAHSSCSNLPLTSPLPTRVIDVGPSDGSEEPRLYIHAEEAQHEAKFAALSYCWGKTQNLTLTTENLDFMKEIIPWDDIPLTIRDAIELTRGIGIRFLWVDALCIIQNSAEDWNHESAKMADVYGGAFVTIAASLAPDVHHGISRDRAWQLARVYDKDWELYDAPLYARGWTFQEHILSVRYLAFGPDKLHYECRTRSAQAGAAETTSIQSFASISKLAGKGIEVWYGIVQEYSCRRLTKSSDKMPALSSLAAMYSEQTGKQYMFGLWKETLIRDLLWKHVPAVVEGEHSRQPEPSIPDFYRAPSWSWVSVDGRVDFSWPEQDLGSAKNDVEVVSTYLDSSPPSFPKWIKDTGHWICLKGTLSQTSIDGREMDISTWGLSGALKLAQWLGLDPPKVWGRAYMDSRIFDISSSKWIEHAGGNNVWTLPFTLTGSGWFGYGLVLEKIENSDFDLFQRIGVFQVRHPNWGKSIRKFWDSNLNSAGKSTVYII